MKTNGIKFIKRLASYIFTLFLLVSLIFILLRLAPGDPTLKFISPVMSPLLSQEVKHSFALDRPLTEQYFYFLKNILSGDFGISYNYRIPVTEVISGPLTFTLIFASISFILQVSLSFLLALFINKVRGGFLDRLLNRLNFFIYSVPTMIIGLLLVYIFSIKLNILPSSDLHSMDFSDMSLIEKIFDYFAHLILPLITLSIPGIVLFYSYLRSGIETTYQKNYILFLRANGTNEKTIFRKHVIPNSIGPLISILGTELGILLSGALITEMIFSLPGMGRLTITAILTRDYPLVVGSVFISGIFVLLANFLADTVKTKFDKRLNSELA
ncbi:MAG: ABC transporter permease [Ignavibacteriales bacterium]|nr:ABC transporter permease [Ignavibacteriales bacterium]